MCDIIDIRNALAIVIYPRAWKPNRKDLISCIIITQIKKYGKILKVMKGFTEEELKYVPSELAYDYVNYQLP